MAVAHVSVMKAIMQILNTRPVVKPIAYHVNHGSSVSNVSVDTKLFLKTQDS